MKKALNRTLIALAILFFALIQPARAAELIRLIVKEEPATCTGVAPQTCLQVKYKNSRDWELFYGSIGGFRYEAGYRYTLDVYRSRRTNVPADAPAYVYKLKRIIKKEKITVAAPAGIAAIADQQWQLTGINGRQLNNARLSLYLDRKENRFSGSDGCNTFFGNFTFNERSSSISFGEAASTLKGCADRAVNQLANEYAQLLRQKDFTYKVDNHIFKLSLKGKVVLEFRNMPLTGNGKPADIWSFIAKHQWRLIQMNGKSLQNATAFMDFDISNNKVSGNAGCNRFFGTYTTNGSQITFGQMGSTRMACTDPAKSKLERDFLALLGKGSYTFDVADQTLNLYQNNNLVLMFGMFNAEKQEGQGLRGTVNFSEGNLMPGTGPRSGSVKPVARDIVIYEKTSQNQIGNMSEDGFYTGIKTKKIATVRSGSDGRYTVNLAPGVYSVFVKEDGRLYANSTDGAGNINTVTVVRNQFTDLDININYNAAY